MPAQPGGTAVYVGAMAKRASAASVDHQIPSRRRTKRPWKLDDLLRPWSTSQIQSLDDARHLCSSAQTQIQIHSQGAKRKTSQVTTTPLFWGAKRARTVLSIVPKALSCSSLRRPVLSIVPKGLSCSSLHRPKWWRDWSNLADGPTELIAERVLADDVADYVRFRAVCAAWRQCAADPREHSAMDSRFHPRRWFMLREDPWPAAPHRRRFMNVNTGQCVQIDLPEIQGNRAFGPTAEGLLVLIDKRTLVVRLLNPFTRQLTDLPSLTMLLLPRKRSMKGLKTCYARDLADGDLSVSGAGLAGEGAIALYFSGARKMLAVAKPGDKRWTLVHCGTWFVTSLSFAGRFYCIGSIPGSACAVMTVKMASGNQPPQLVVAAKLGTRYSPMTDSLHLVENGRGLMLVHRTISFACDDGHNDERSYQVYRVDLDARKTMPVHGLNGQAVFIGRLRSLSVCPEVFPSISADTIYPGFEVSEIGYKFDIYHLSGRSTEPSTYSYDVSRGFILARPYRIIDILSIYVRGYRDIEPKSCHKC